MAAEEEAVGEEEAAEGERERWVPLLVVALLVEFARL